VTLYGHAKPVDWYVKELRLAFYDHPEVDIDHHDLRQVVSSAHRDWQQGKRVLVRCQAGWNRSGLIMALILIKDGLKPDQAIDLIRNRRSSRALCNRSFENWILTEAERVLGETTLLPAA
jgi:protein-tyrosine phosphatase